MFPTDRFQDVMEDFFVEARLHNDDSQWGASILKLQDDYVGHRGLPVYMVMRPDGREVLGMFELPATGAQDDKLLAFLTAQRDEAAEAAAP